MYNYHSKYVCTGNINNGLLSKAQSIEYQEKKLPLECCVHRLNNLDYRCGYIAVFLGN